MKILIIRFSSIGDIVLTTPVIRCVKMQLPNSKIHYLTKSSFAPIVNYNPYIDKLHYLSDNLEEIILALKKEKFDYVIDLHHNLRTMRVKRALGIKDFYSYPKLNIKKWLLTVLKLNLMPDKSIVERYFETVKTLKVTNDGKGLEFFIHDEHKLGNNDIPMAHWGGYVGCVIGGSYKTKQLPLEQWKIFCELVPYPVILLGGTEDRELGAQIAEQDPIKIYNSCGKFNLNESGELVKHAKVIVSNDTGLMHIAAAYQKPIISLWGNTSPQMGMYPYYGYNNLKERVSTKSIIVENKDLACHPCSKLGYSKCPKKHFLCMNSLDMKFVAEQVVSLWKQNDIK